MIGAALPLSLVTGGAAAPPGFLDLTHAPDLVTARTSTGEQQLRRTPGSTGQWDGAGLSVRTVTLPRQHFASNFRRRVPLSCESVSAGAGVSTLRGCWWATRGNAATATSSGAVSSPTG